MKSPGGLLWQVSQLYENIVNEIGLVFYRFSWLLVMIAFLLYTFHSLFNLLHYPQTTIHSVWIKARLREGHSGTVFSIVDPFYTLRPLLKNSTAAHMVAADSTSIGHFATTWCFMRWRQYGPVDNQWALVENRNNNRRCSFYRDVMGRPGRKLANKFSFELETYPTV